MAARKTNKGKEYLQREKRMAEFLEHLAETDRVLCACEKVGVASSTVYGWRDEYPEFRAAWDRAKDRYREKIRQLVYHHAFIGVEEPVYQQGQLIGTVTKYNTRMMELEAKRADPSYRDNHKDSEGESGGGVLVAPAAVTPEEWIAEAMAAAKAKGKPGD